MDHAKTAKAAQEYADANVAVAKLEAERDALMDKLAHVNDNLARTEAGRDVAFRRMNGTEPDAAEGEQASGQQQADAARIEGTL